MAMGKEGLLCKKRGIRLPKLYFNTNESNTGFLHLQKLEGFFENIIAHIEVVC